MSLLMPMITNVELFVPSRYRNKYEGGRRGAEGSVVKGQAWLLEMQCGISKRMSAW